MRLRIMKGRLTTIANLPVLKNCTSGVILVNIIRSVFYKEVRGSGSGMSEGSKSGIVALNSAERKPCHRSCPDQCLSLISYTLPVCIG